MKDEGNQNIQQESSQVSIMCDLFSWIIYLMSSPFFHTFSELFKKWIVHPISLGGEKLLLQFFCLIIAKHLKRKCDASKSSKLPS